MEAGSSGETGNETGTLARLLLLLGSPTAIIVAVFAGYLLATFWPRSQTRTTQQDPSDNTEPNMSGSRRSNSSQTECPICIDPPKYAVETNCGHIFCASCFVQNWQANFTTQPMLCPFCRQEVTLLIPCLSENERNTEEAEEMEERDRVMGEVGQYNRMHSDHPRSYYSQVQDLPIILRHMWNELFTWRGLEMLSKFRVVVCLITAVLYTVSPVDLLPEAFLGLVGLVDDAIVIGVLLVQVSAVYRTIVANRDW